MADFSQNRSVFIRILFIAVPTIIILRLLFLQVFDAGGYKEAAVGQAVYMKKIYPPRGIIYDRKNKVLMNNSIVYDLSVDPKKLNADFDTAFLCKLLHVRLENFQTLYKKLLVRNGFQKPFSMYKNLSPTAVARLQESLNDFSGLDLIEQDRKSVV